MCHHWKKETLYVNKFDLNVDSLKAGFENGLIFFWRLYIRRKGIPYKESFIKDSVQFDISTAKGRYVFLCLFGIVCAFH